MRKCAFVLAALVIIRTQAMYNGVQCQYLHKTACSLGDDRVMIFNEYGAPVYNFSVVTDPNDVGKLFVTGLEWLGPGWAGHGILNITFHRSGLAPQHLCEDLGDYFVQPGQPGVCFAGRKYIAKSYGNKAKIFRFLKIDTAFYVDDIIIEINEADRITHLQWQDDDKLEMTCASGPARVYTQCCNVNEAFRLRDDSSRRYQIS